MPVVGGDDRAAARARAVELDDPRIEHRWAGDRAIGRFLLAYLEREAPELADRPPFGGGYVWDAYLLWDAGVRWGKAGPDTAPRAGGATIMNERGPLRRALRRRGRLY